MKLTRFEDLDCWKEARQLTRQVYEAIEQNSAWKRDARLCGQIQSAAGSVMANIAEGFVRRLNKEFTPLLSTTGFTQHLLACNLLKSYARHSDSESRSPGRTDAVQDPVGAAP